VSYDNFLEFLIEVGSTKEDFSQRAEISKLTLKGWGTTRSGKKTPSWVRSWLKLYQEILSQNDEITFLMKQNLSLKEKSI